MRTTTTTTMILGTLVLGFVSSAFAFVPIRHVPSSSSTITTESSTSVAPSFLVPHTTATTTLGPSSLRSLLFLASDAAKDATSDDSDHDDESTTSSYPIKIIISGAPASGKGTQCEMIKEKFGVVHLSTGDMLRAAVAARTKVGLAAQEYMDKGKLVPDEVIIGVVQDRLSQEDCARQGWLLDGFPRTPAQAQALEDAGVVADCFVFLDVPDEVLVERVVGRRTDPATGKIYHLTFSPPPQDDQALLARLEHRTDDTEDKVKVRLQQFHANVNAVKDRFADISVTINGNRNPTLVAQDILQALEQAKKGAAAAAAQA